MNLWDSLIIICFSLAAFRILPLSLIFATFIMSWCGSVWIQIVWGLCASCSWIFVSFFRYEKFSAIISPNLFSIPFSFSSTSQIPFMHRLHAFYYPTDLLYCFHFFFHLVFCLLSWLDIISIILSSRSLILSSALFILLFNAFNSAIVFVSEFYNFSHFLLIVSSPFLK